jgi:hypothetical protein
MIEGDAELLAGLHQPDHDVAGNAIVDADGPAGDLAPGDEGRISFSDALVCSGIYGCSRTLSSSAFRQWRRKSNSSSSV